MARQTNEEIRAIGKVAKIFEEISVSDRTYVLSFLRGIEGGARAAKVPGRIDAALAELEPAARKRVIDLFNGQVAEAYSRERGEGASA